jgi:poly(3-hydroxybutyrate) depolymerase
VPVLAAVSLMASRKETLPLSMTMMGGPIDATKSPTAVNNLAMNKSYHWFENNVIYRVPASFPGAGRRVYPGFLQHSGFVAMNPDRHLKSHYDYFKDLIKGDNSSAESHRQFYDEYNAVLDMDADYYLETIATVFQEFKLVRGTWDVKSDSGAIERVRPQDITNCGLLTVEGELDDISGSGQTKAALNLCTGILSNQKMNAYLKEIVAICEIEKELTFHIARHTFATTITLTNGVPIESVSKMLGHKNLRTTQHYAKVLDRKVSEDMKLLKDKFIFKETTIKKSGAL